MLSEAKHLYAWNLERFYFVIAGSASLVAINRVKSSETLDCFALLAMTKNAACKIFYCHVERKRNIFICHCERARWASVANNHARS